MKRPLLWMMVAYVLGIFSYEIKREYIILSVFLWCAMLPIFFASNFWSTKKEKYLSSILIFLPLFLLFGHIRMNRQVGMAPIEQLVLEKVEGTVTGTVEEIQCYEDSNALVISNVRIKVNNSDDIYNCEKAIVYVSIEDSVHYGNLISIKGSIYPLTRASNPGQFNQYFHYKSKDISIKIYPNELRILNESKDPIKHNLFVLKERLKSMYQQLLPEKEAGVLIAMLLGDKALLTEDMMELYQENGISHILAISGLHMSFFGLTLFKLIRKLKCNLILSTVLVILLILFYGILTNNSVSANRSIVMLILLLMSTILGKTYDILSALSLSALIQLIGSPMQLYQASFLLSYGAMLGIALIYPIFKSKNIIVNKPVIKSILEGFYISLSVQIITLPIVTHFFFEITTYSVFLNIAVVPLLSILFPMAVVAGLIAFISIPVAAFGMGIVYYILVIYEKLCDLFDQLPYHLYLIGKPNVISILAFYVIVAISSYLCIKWEKKKALLLYLICLIPLFWSEDPLKINFLDVGQGDAIVLQNDNGNVYMIDGGSTSLQNVGDKRIIPFLKSQGIARIRCAFITHADADHMNGIQEIILKMKDGNIPKKHKYNGDVIIETLCLPKLASYNETYQELIITAKKKGIHVIFMGKHEVMLDEKLILSCLAPVEQMNILDTNAHSLVLHLSYGAFDALFTGDMDGNGELRVVETLKESVIRNFEVLKVGHHGSKESSHEDFIAYLKPTHAIISCSRNNRYGHPHIETINVLGEVDATIHNTSDHGAIQLKTDGSILKVEKFLK